MSRNPDKDNTISNKAVWELVHKQDYYWWCCMQL